MTSQQPPNTPPGQWPGYPPPPTPPGQWPGYPPPPTPPGQWPATRHRRHHPGQWPGYPPAGAPGQPWAQYLDPYARRKTPKRTYVYLALWITGVAFLAFTIIIGGYSTYTLQTRTARTDATIAREVPEAGRSHGYATTYTWVVDGITYSGYQTRTDKHYWSDPPFVCYNPGDPGQGTLAWPDRQDCSRHELGSGGLDRKHRPPWPPPRRHRPCLQEVAQVAPLRSPGKRDPCLGGEQCRI